MATSKTVPCVSDSFGPNPDTENLSYLIMFSYNHGGTVLTNLDKESYLFADSIEEIMPLVHKEWNNDLEVKDIRVLPFYPSQIKCLKQTVELV